MRAHEHSELHQRKGCLTHSSPNGVQKKLNFSFVVQILSAYISQVECIWLSHAIGRPDESP
jgi:hypothetical protein